MPAVADLLRDCSTVIEAAQPQCELMDEASRLMKFVSSTRALLRYPSDHFAAQQLHHLHSVISTLLMWLFLLLLLMISMLYLFCVVRCRCPLLGCKGTSPPMRVPLQLRQFSRSRVFDKHIFMHAYIMSIYIHMAAQRATNATNCSLQQPHIHHCSSLRLAN
jgi:hypothetical protein